MAEGERSATRAGFGTSRKCFQSAQGVGGENLSLFVSQVSPVHVSRRRNPAEESCFAHIGKAALDFSLQKAQVQATVPPVAEQVKHSSWRLSSASEWVQWAQDTYGAPSRRGGSSDGKKLP